MASNHQPRRLKIRVPVQLTGEDGKVYAGMSNDVSPFGFSAFLRCREDFVVDELSSAPAEAPHVLHNFPKLEELFLSRQFRSVFNLDMELPPQQSTVARVENSWLRGFEVFVAARFSDIEEAESGRIMQFIVDQTPQLPPEALVEDPDRVAALDAIEGDTINLEFPGRYLFIPVVRDVCEQLARQAGFSEMDCFKIKVSADEVFSNAFRHGSPDYGDDKIHVVIKLAHDGILVRVRDEGGIPFDFRRFRRHDESGDSDGLDVNRLSGMHLVDKFVDNWTVSIEEGTYTEVAFYKKKEVAR